MGVLKYSIPLLVVFSLLSFVASETHPLTCQSAETFLPDGTPPTKSYRLVYEWEDKNNTYNYLLRYADPAERYHNSPIVRCLHVVLTFHSEYSFRLKILDGNAKRWEIPDASPFPHFRHSELIPKEDSWFKVETRKDPFSIRITNKKTGEVIFDTNDQEFVFTNLYIQLATKIPSDNVYGFGERAYKFKLNPGIYTLWCKDEPDVIEDGRGGKNVYGHQPVGLFRGEKGNFFVSIMRNSNAKDVIIDKDNILQYKMIGGIIDLVFFVGDDYPDTAIKRYHEYAGKFVMMPFWSLGYHQSRWGYTDIDKFETVVDNFQAHKIPIDVIWSDVDYMIEKETFTLDETRFPADRLRAMITNKKIKWVPIVDCGIKVGGVNNQKVRSRAFDEGVKRNIFLRNSKNEFMLAKVWPGAVFFPDFFNPDTEAYWGEMLDDFYDTVPFSGLWIDMNEVTNFVHGECQVLHNELVPVIGRVDPYGNIPYKPGYKSLELMTSSMDAVHHGGLLEYDVHELFNIMQSKVTYDYMKSKTKLPFILTRSNFAGNGQYAAMWSGDNAARWEFLKYSITGIMSYQIFGMPFAGSDICGFMRTTTPELCLRWYQTGAFYPFARNHNNDMAREQEPWVFRGQHLGEELLNTARASLKLRYAILKWYYSLFIATRGTGSVFKPLFFEFPHDDELYQSDGPTENQFLLGSGFMITPQLEQGNRPINAYFPRDDWFNFNTGEKVIGKETENRYISMAIPYEGTAPVFLRAGNIVHIQNVEKVFRTEDLNDEFELIVAFGRNPETKKLEAKGSILGVQSYDETTIHDRCVLENCLYNITAEVIKERKNDVTVSIKFEGADAAREKMLDDLALYGLKLYNLPLEFMEEDEDKVGNTMGLLYGKDGDISQTLLTKETISIAQDSFVIPFLNFARIKGGDTLVIKIIL